VGQAGDSTDGPRNRKKVIWGTGLDGRCLYGTLDGIVLAEVELEHPDQDPQLPPWLGEEVTNDPRYEKGTLARRAVWVTP
jgi:CYTH domain-containing protein